MKGSERRAHQRFSSPGRDGIEVLFDNAKRKTFPLNFSLQGAAIALESEIPMGSLVNLQFPHEPNKKYIEVKSKIIWKRKIGKLEPNLGYDFFLSDEFDWIYGLLFYQTPIENIRLIDAFPRKFNLPHVKDRRSTNRRVSIKNFEIKELRNFDRRSFDGFYRKINRFCNSFDKWATYHTYARPISSVKYPFAEVYNEKKIMLGSNSYLGLSTHPRVMEAAIKAVEKFGVGSGGVPVLSGTTILHEELCETIAQFKGAEAAVLYPSGYIANVACISTLFGDSDVVIFNDERNHASLIDGCRSSKTNMRFFRHNDMDDLEKKLKQYPFEQSKIIIVDGVYSMDGDICNLPVINSLAETFNSMTYVDDAHSTGVLGKTGRGTAEHFNLTGEIDLTTVTLSKAIGCVGGAICGPNSMIKFLKYLSRPFIFSTSLPAPICAAATTAFKIILEEPNIVQNLRKNVDFLMGGLTKLGYKAIPTQSAIIPVIIGNEILTYRLVHMLNELGVFVNAVSRPAVPREHSRLRISPCAQHTEEELTTALRKFKIAGEKLKVI